MPNCNFKISKTKQKTFLPHITNIQHTSPHFLIIIERHILGLHNWYSPFHGTVMCIPYLYEQNLYQKVSKSRLFS